MIKIRFCEPIVLLFTILLVMNSAVIADGPYRGKTLTDKELREVLGRHSEFLQIYKGKLDTWEAISDPRRANLNEADLSEAILSGAILSGAMMSKAILSKADLSRASLSEAILSKAILSKADLSMTNLNRAYLYEANLSDADLTLADLRGAVMIDADITNSLFSPKEVPAASKLYGIKGLSKIRINDVSIIVKLRSSFKEAGFKNEEKQLTSAIYKYQMGSRPIAQRLFSSYILGGLITDYGADPFGAFVALVFFIPVFLCVYFVALLKPSRTSGIWRIRPSDRIIKGDADQELLSYRGKQSGWALLMALYFSFLMAFHFGWRELNLANWVMRIQRNEYVLRPTGWVRTVSGIQSLISLYLVALWLLTYFGSPFE